MVVLDLLLAAALTVQPPGGYVVCVEPGAGDAFLPAAQALAQLHDARVVRFDAGDLAALFGELRELQPEFVAFVLPPQRIDVDLTHDILEQAVRIDDDPFVDFEYAFITGRDGAAALRFVERIAQARVREYGRRVTLLGTWEGRELPDGDNRSALAAMRLQGEFAIVPMQGEAAERRAAAQRALAQCRDKDALLLFSHGYPDEMVGVFRAADLREGQVDLAPAVVVSCACYNGAPGRWFAPASGGTTEDRGVVAPQDSIALAILDAGVPAFVGGVDPWHGPLANQVFVHLADDGMRLGEAAKAMHDRLALAFLPERIDFVPTMQVAGRFGGEGTTNRRHNGAGMIVYGDPAWAPFAANATRLCSASVEAGEDGGVTVRIVCAPLIDGSPGDDYILPMSRLLDYYSVRGSDVVSELALEIYRVVPWSQEVPALRVVSARCKGRDVPTGELQVVLEKRLSGNRLHVRVPIAARALRSRWLRSIAKSGIELVLAGQ